MKAITFIANPAAEHHVYWGTALAAGLERHGVRVHMHSTREGANTEHVACWGWRIGKRMRHSPTPTMARRPYKHYDVLVMEHGFIGDRSKWTSISWNGLNGRAEWPANLTAEKMGIERFSKNHPGMLKRRREPTPEDFVIIAGQVPGDMAVEHVDMDTWYAMTYKHCEIREAIKGLPIYFRPHPRAPKPHPQPFPQMGPTTIPTNEWPLVECFARAREIWTFNSNLAVDAILAGVPTVTYDNGSMAFEQGMDVYGNKPGRGRLQWAAELAWKQWTEQEIRSGFVWEMIGLDRFQ